MASWSLATDSRSRIPNSPTGSQSAARDDRTAPASPPTRSTICSAIATFRRVTPTSSVLSAGFLRSDADSGRTLSLLVQGGSALHIPAFRRLAVSYAINEFGDNFALIALAVVVFDSTGSALATAALFVAAKFVPAFTAPAITARTDRMASRTVLPALYLLEAAAFAALAVFAAHDAPLPAILVLAFIDGTIALTARALSRAAVAAVLIPHDALRAGNSVLNVAFSVTSATGPAIAGIVVATASAATVLGIAGVFFSLPSLLLASTLYLP